MFVHILAARPNFIKASPLIKRMKCEGIPFKIIHTGQHYDRLMSGSFLELLDIPTPDLNLGIGSGTHAEQVGNALIKLEKAFLNINPSAVIVYGDVNATLSASLAAVKINIPIIHIEAGCRSRDMTMPEEVNRVLVDRISDMLFTTSKDSLLNLKKEGIPKEKCFFVGNTMIDSLVNFQDEFDKSKILKQLKISPKKYNLCTFHRPSNVDNLNSLKSLMDALAEVNKIFPCILPLHPRTKNKLKELNLFSFYSKKLLFTPPQEYFDFMCLQKNAKCVITDSGGIQEESSYFNVPCLTLRDNTERPITITNGTNKLIGTSYKNLMNEFNNINFDKKSSIELWDGNSSERIVEILINKYGK